MASKANRWAVQTAKFQEKQRQAVKDKLSKLNTEELKNTFAKAAAIKTTLPPLKATSPGSTKITGTFHANSSWTKVATTSNTSIPITGTYSNGTVFSTGGTVLPNGTITFKSPPTAGSTFVGNHAVNWIFDTEEPKDPELPSDDVTRQMVERAVLAAIDRCLAADHYPVGIALSQIAYDALKESPMCTSNRGYWFGGFQSERALRFLDLPLHVVEMIDPLDVEAGW